MCVCVCVRERECVWSRRGQSRDECVCLSQVCLAAVGLISAL